METFGNPILEDVSFNSDGSLKQSGKQAVRFYAKKRLAFKAKFQTNEDGSVKLDENGKKVLDIDPKTGLPKKEAYDEVVEMVRIETRGDTNIVDDVANDFHKRQFYRQYKYFREGKIPDGNPIEDFDWLQPSTIMELHMFGIHTIQMVADMTELECTQLKDQSGYEIRDIARQWVTLNSPQGQAGKASKLEMENAKLKRELEEARSSRRGIAASGQEMAAETLVEEAPLNTIELTPEQLSRPRGRPRKV